MILEIIFNVVREEKVYSTYVEYLIIPDPGLEPEYWPEKEIQAKLDYLNKENPYRNPEFSFKFKECNNLSEANIVKRLRHRY